MKYKRLMGLTLASLLVLSGCSSTTSDNGKDVLATLDGKNILADDVYDHLTSSTAGENALFSYVLDQLINAHFPVNDDMKENADELITNIQANYRNQYGENADARLESALASDGYNSLDEYKDALIYSLQMAEFRKTYVKDNFDKVFEDYYKIESPRYISVIKVAMSDVDKPTDEEKEKLEEVKSLLKTEKSFGDIASEYSDDSSKTAKGNLGIVDSTLELGQSCGESVEKAAFELKENEISDPIKGNDGYYFLQCTNTNKDDIKEELKNVDIDSPLLVYDQYLVYFAFETYDLKYGNDDIKKTIDKIVKESLKAREELRGGQS